MSCPTAADPGSNDESSTTTTPTTTTPVRWSFKAGILLLPMRESENDDEWITQCKEVFREYMAAWYKEHGETQSEAQTFEEHRAGNELTVWYTSKEPAPVRAYHGMYWSDSTAGVLPKHVAVRKFEEGRDATRERRMLNDLSIFSKYWKKDSLSYVSSPFRRESLREFLKSNSSPGARYQLARACFACVEFMHTKSTYHGNIQPSNIFVENEGGLRVLTAEFVGDSPAAASRIFGSEGSLKVITANFARSSLEGPTANTASQNASKWISPQAEVGSFYASRNEDVWSLGLVLYEIVCFRESNPHPDIPLYYQDMFPGASGDGLQKCVDGVICKERDQFTGMVIKVSDQAPPSPMPVSPLDSCNSPLLKDILELMLLKKTVSSSEATPTPAPPGYKKTRPKIKEIRSPFLWTATTVSELLRAVENTLKNVGLCTNKKVSDFFDPTSLSLLNRHQETHYTRQSNHMPKSWNGVFQQLRLDDIMTLNDARRRLRNFDCHNNVPEDGLLISFPLFFLELDRFLHSRGFTVIEGSV